MVHILTNTEEIEALLKRALTDALLATLPPLVRKSTRKAYLTQAELRELTGWTNRTLQYLRDSRQLAFSQVGRTFVYSTDGLDRCLERHTVPARSPDPHTSRGRSNG